MSTEDLEQYRDKMLSIAIKILRDRDVAEDVVQEAMLSAISWLNKEPIGKLEAWLVATVTNGSYAASRAQKRRDRLDELVAPVKGDKRQRNRGHGYSGGDGMHELPQTPVRELPFELLSVALAKIDRFNRDMLVEKYIDGKPDVELATQYGVSQSRFRGILAEARSEFRKVWNELTQE